MTFSFAGAERQSVNLARYLRDVQGAEVEFWAFVGPGALQEVCRSEGFRSRLVPVDWAPGRVRRLRAILRFAAEVRRARIDVLLPFTAQPNVICGLAWRLGGAHFCLWNQRAAHPFLRGSRFEALALRLAPCVVSNSQHAAADLVHLHGLPAGRIHVIPNGVELEPARRTRTEWRADLGLQAGCDVVVMLAGLRNDKDHATVLRAWRTTLDRHPGPTSPVLVLAGPPGNAEHRVKALAFDLGLGSRVRFLGHVGDVSGLLAASDLAVFATVYEGVPNGVLEAMAAGLLVVACDHPAIREALGEEQPEWVVPAGDAEALADRLLAALADPATRTRQGEINRRSVARRFALKTMCERTARLIAAAPGRVPPA